MAVSVETSSSQVGGAVSSLTWSYTVTSANLLLIAAGAGDATAGDRALSSATYAAAATSSFPTTTAADDGNFLCISLRYQASPAAGANNVVVTFGGSCDNCAAGATGFITADTGTFGTVASASSLANTNAAVTVASASDEIVFAAVSSDSNVSITENGTLQWEYENRGGDVSFGAQTLAGAASVNATWTGSSPDNGWAAIGVSIKPAASGAAAPIGFISGTKAPPGTAGPRDRLGFLRQQVWDYTVAVAAPSTVAQVATSLAMSTAFAIGVAIFSGDGTATAQSTPTAPATGIASGAGITTAQSTAQATATGIAAGAGVSVSPATGSAGGAPTGAGSGATTAQSLARGTGAPVGAGGGASIAQSVASGAGSSTGAGSGMSTGGAYAVAIGQAVVPGVGGVTTAQSTAAGSGASIGAGGGCTTSVSSARASSASIAAGTGSSSSPSRGVAASAPTAAGAGISVAQSAVVGSSAAAVPTVLVPGPLFINFDEIAVSVDFDDLTTRLDCDDIATTIRFLSLTGEEVMGPLKLYEGEVVDVQFVLKGAGDVPQDLSAASSIKWTVGTIEDVPVVNQAVLVVVAPATNGRVKYPANAALAAVGGRYKSLAVVTFPGGIVRKFPGDVLIESAIA